MSQANGNGKASLKSLRESVTRTRLERELKQEQLAAKMLESAFPWGLTTDQGRIVPPREIVEPSETSGSWGVDARERQKGSHYFAYRSWDELREIWATARWLADSNPYMPPLIGGLMNKVIGKGFSYRPVAKPHVEGVTEQLLRQVQAALDAFDSANRWVEWEREIFERTRIDGEAFIRYADSEDILLIRPIEPEQVIQPPDEQEGPEWSYGVHCDPDDQQTVVGYFVSYSGDPAEDGKEIDAKEVLHFKVNVRRTVRRGLSDFYCIASLADQVRKIARNMLSGGSILAAIAWIEQFEGATKSDVDAFAAAQANYTTRNPTNQQLNRYEKIEPGTIVRTGKGKEYKSPPLAANTANFVEIARLGKQALANRWNAPEVLTGDASNGTFSSLGIAESPFVAKAECEQSVFYGPRFKEVKIRAIQHAIDRQRLPEDTLQKVDLHVEPPPVIVRNRLEHAQENETKLRMGTKSPQTVAQEDGLKWEEQQAQIQKAKEAGWVPPAGAALPAPGLGMLGEGRTVPLWSTIMGSDSP